MTHEELEAPVTINNTHLEINRTRMVGDMETERTCFIASGHNLEEAKEGIMFLLSCEKETPNNLVARLIDEE